MRLADLERALGWAAAEGWNPGLDDAAAFHAQDRDGFLMGWLGNEPVGCISVVKYASDFAFLGLYIVRPEYRGKGYGKAIWDAGIASAAGRTIGLDGVPDQQENYAKSGFRFAHRNARWTGMLTGAAGDTAAVVPLGPSDVALAETFDRQHVAAPRGQFLQAWLSPAESRRTLGYIEDGRLRGYGTIRRCVEGWKVGPLFAETRAIADSLLAAMAPIAGTDQVSIDVPEPNAEAVSLVSGLGFTLAFPTARMYLGTPPQLPLGLIYGITTLELG